MQDDDTGDVQALAQPEAPEASESSVPAPMMAPRELPTLHVPIPKAHLKHAVVGSKVHIHLHGEVKGVRGADGKMYPNPEVELKPTHSSLKPKGAKGKKNKFEDLAEEH